MSTSLANPGNADPDAVAFLKDLRDLHPGCANPDHLTNDTSFRWVNSLGLPADTTTSASRRQTCAVRARISVLSNCAKAPKIWKMSIPPADDVSVDSVNERKAAPRRCKSSTVSPRCLSDRPSLSSRQTTRVSPARR